MSSQVLTRASSHLNRIDGLLLSNAAKSELNGLNHPDAIIEDMAETPFLIEVADGLATEFSTGILCQMSSTDMAVELDAWFSFGVARTCFAFKLASQRELTLDSGDTSPRDVAEALNILEDHMRIGGIINGFKDDVDRVVERGYRSIEDDATPYAGRYPALHAFSLSGGEEAKRLYQDVVAHGFAAAGGLISLGVIGRSIDACLYQERAREQSEDRMVADMFEGLNKYMAGREKE